jgi:hypothetical protein
MLRLVTTCVIMVGAALAGGCEQPSIHVRPYAGYASVYPAHQSEGRNPALLFDRLPGEPTACDFNTRSDWPSSYGRQLSGEVTSYITYFDDQGGTGFPGWDTVYRSARYYQVGQLQR